MQTSDSSCSPALAGAGLVLVLLLGGCATTPTPPPVTVEQVVQMSQEGLATEEIIKKMDDSDTVYRLSGSELARLKERGVPDEVLDYMQDTFVAYERSRVYRYYDPWWGPPYAYSYPYWGFYGYYGRYYPPYYYPPYYHGHPPPHDGHPPKPPSSPGGGAKPPTPSWGHPPHSPPKPPSSAGGGGKSSSPSWGSVRRPRTQVR